MSNENQPIENREIQRAYAALVDSILNRQGIRSSIEQENLFRFIQSAKNIGMKDLVELSNLGGKL
jgi:hypothetical protein